MMKKELFLAKTFAGIESLLYDELIALGAENCQILNRSVQFEGPIELMYRANYFCRTALRILWQVDSFTFSGNNDFYSSLFNFPAENFLAKEGTLAISSTMHNSIFNTPLFASVLAKDAICDRFRDKFGVRPSVDKENPDVQFHIHIFNDTATLFVDSSGDSLHKRGYKVSNHPAPINEVVAAAMIKLSGWHAECDLIDFMCGSGTILIEAAMAALNIPAGFYRSHYGFFSWLNFDSHLWNKVIEEALILSDIDVNLYGFDISPRYLGMAKVNVDEADLHDFISLKKKDMRLTSPIRTPACIISNPPYGERLEVDDINAFYKQIGDTLKNNYPQCSAFIISSDFDALKSVGLHPSRRFTLFNGQLECKFMKYELYKGKKYDN